MTTPGLIVTIATILVLLLGPVVAYFMLQSRTAERLHREPTEAEQERLERFERRYGDNGSVSTPTAAIAALVMAGGIGVAASAALQALTANDVASHLLGIGVSTTAFTVLYRRYVRPDTSSQND